MLLELIKLHDLCHDESLLKVCVNPPRGLRSLESSLDGPGLDLVRSSREEVNQLQSLVSLDNDFIQSGGTFGLLLILFPLILS